MNNEPVAWMDYLEHSDVYDLNVSGRGIPLYTHPVKELNDAGEPVKNATYWKRQYNLMATQNDNLKSGLYHANEQIKYLESQLDIRTRELIGASFYEHDYKTLMAKPPLTDKEIEQIGRKEFGYWDSYNEELLDFARAILRKAQEK